MFKRIVLSVMAVAAGAAALGVMFLALRKPSAAAPRNVQVPMTPERIARGEYLFEILADCGGCHSRHDEMRFGRPVIPEGRGEGFVFPAVMGLPGTVVARNITPDKETGIGAWTDGEKIRAIREGIRKDGTALFPMMPYGFYRSMSDEDVEALVAYLNSLAPVRNALPETQLDFPVVLTIKDAPRPVEGPVAPPDRSDRVKYGEYLATIAGCAECHTPMERGRPVMTRRLSGGRAFVMPRATVVSANITPDPETGIGRWSEAQFLDKFYQYKEYAEKGSPEVGPEGYTLMPWLTFTKLSPEELGAIFTYLKTQPAVKNAVETHPGHS